jgi:hypothetical protein
MATENNTIRTKVDLDASQASQQIAKLNAVASDSTKSLEERIAAKNKQVELQAKLSKNEISAIERKIKALREVGGYDKEVRKETKKLNAARLKAVKISANLTKQQNSLNKSLKGSAGAFNAADRATGGFLTKLQMLAANPVILVMTVLVGTMRLLKEAFTSSEEGQNAWNKGMAVMNTLLGNLLDVVAEVAEALYKMAKMIATDPVKAMKDFGRAIQEGIMNRLTGILELIPKLAVAIKQLFEKDFVGAAKTATDAIAKIATGMDSVTDAVDKGIEKSKEWIAQQADEAKKSQKVADMRAEADKLERALIVKKSNDLTKIADLRLKSREEDKYSAEVRRAALIEAQGYEDSLIASEKEYLILRRDAQIEENKFSRSNKENLMKEAEAKAAVNNAEAARLNIARQVQREITRIDGQIRKEAARLEKLRLAELARLAKIRAEELAEMQRYADEEWRIHLETLTLKREADEAAAIEKQRILDADYEALILMDELEIERLQNKGDRTFDLEIALLVRKRDHELAVFEGTLLEKQALEMEYGVAIGKLQMEQVAQAKKSDADMLKSGVMAAAEMFGVSKEAAIALALIKAPEAISNVWAEAGKQPTLPQVLLHGVGGTAMVIAPIVKSLANIKKTKMKGKAGGRSSSSGGNISPVGIGSTNVDDLSANNAANINSEAGLNSSASAAAANNVLGAQTGDIIFQEGQYNDFQDQINFVEGQTDVD